MKFVVNRVHKSSCNKEKDLQGNEVIIDSLLAAISTNDWNCNGWATGCVKTESSIKTCYGFTIAEIDNEGYLL